MAKITIDNEGLKSVADAVKKAESETSGEIATAFIKQSDTYAYYELIFSLAVGFIYFFVIMLYSNKIELLLKGMFWDYNTSALVAFTGLSTFLIIGIFYLISNIPAIDRIIVPKKIRNMKVRNRALRYFTESGVYDTRDRTGILIFISLLERRVELIADRGIDEKIKPEQWNGIVDNIVNGVKAGNWIKSLSESILECGNILKEHFPIKEDDENELKDEIAILEN